jgi:para-nitrobenzyl esterase
VVWITGGGYLACDSANPHLLAGDSLAMAGAVVVSAHYRSGVEGFLRMDGAPDNHGLLDQLAALAWVHDTIAAFGGGPGNVTAFGQSAGAGSIASLLVMPAAAGAIRRAILQGIPGTYFPPTSPTTSPPRSAPSSDAPPRPASSPTSRRTTSSRRSGG